MSRCTRQGGRKVEGRDERRVGGRDGTCHELLIDDAESKEYKILFLGGMKVGLRVKRLGKGRVQRSG